MSRIRSVHPGLWTDERFVCGSMQARLLLIGIWGECDDQGVFEWAPLKLKMRIFPADNIAIADHLNELGQIGLIQSFSADGRNYGAVRNFMKWQRPKSPQAVHPLPDEIASYVGKPEDGGDKPERGTALGKLLWEQQGGLCFYCSEEITYYRKKATSLEIDHRKPLALGGEDSVANLVAACKPCNSLKGALPEAVFRERFAVNDLVANCREKRGSHSANGKFADSERDAKTRDGEATKQMEEEGGRRKDEKKDGGANYAFAGRTIRLNQADFNNWRSRFHAIPDMAAELTALDAWLGKQPDDKRKSWFHQVPGMLNRKHQELLSAAKAEARAGGEMELPIA